MDSSSLHLVLRDGGLSHSTPASAITIAIHTLAVLCRLAIGDMSSLGVPVVSAPDWR